MYFPKISIVTPSFNQGKYIEQTIVSVINQGYPNLEYIIIDGGSTDNTVEIIKKYEHKLTYWVSEKDEGQAHALNKGLLHCTGDIFNWINSDDYLPDGVLFTIAGCFSDTKVDMVSGAVQNFDKNGPTQLFLNKNLSIENILSEEWDYVYHQPGVWFRMNQFKKTGFLSTDFNYCFDHEFMLRFLLQHPTVLYIDKLIAFFRIHDTSKTVSQSANFHAEFRKMFHEFSIGQKGLPYFALAKKKDRLIVWGDRYGSIRKRYRGRVASFIVVFFAMIKDPRYRLNKKGIGRLKHILLGEKEAL